MTSTREAFEHLRSALADAVRFDAASGCSDDELLTAMSALEALGRLVDAHRAAFAGEIAERSRVELADQRLSARKGCRSAAELVERVTQVSAFEARRRIALGSATRARSGLTGEAIETEFPLVAAALAAGALGSSISGSGPTAFALARGRESAERIGAAMEGAYRARGIGCRVRVGPVDRTGATVTRESGATR